MTSVYEFIPDALIDKVINRDQFLGMLAFDRWVGNSDFRQAVFVSDRSGPERAFLAMMIDHGLSFGGDQWTFVDSAIAGYYVNGAVYRNVRSINDFEPWLSQIQCFSESYLQISRQSIPAEWSENDAEQLDSLLDQLLRRRPRVPELLAMCRILSDKPFQNLILH
jgi:hypothetical protein